MQKIEYSNGHHLSKQLGKWIEHQHQQSGREHQSADFSLLHFVLGKELNGKMWWTWTSAYPLSNFLNAQFLLSALRLGYFSSCCIVIIIFKGWSSPIKLCWESNFAAHLFSHFWDSYYAAPQYPSNSHLQPHSMVWSLYPSNSHRRQWLAVRTRSNNYKIIGLLTGAYIGRIFRKHYYGNCLHHHYH